MVVETMAILLSSPFSRVVGTHLSEEKCATKAEFFIVYIIMIVERYHHHHDYDQHITIALIIPYIASSLPD